jgi:ribosomal protein S18 acetylase RimI-like enzyme
MNIELIVNENKKSEICRKVLSALPEWFGIEEATEEYIEGVQGKQFLSAKIDDDFVGFYSIADHFPETSEIYVCGVLPQYHRKGIGKLLQIETEKLLRAQNKKFLTVKTLSSEHSDEGYAKTRKFYESQNFIPLEIFTELWGKDLPCLYLVKAL